MFDSWRWWHVMPKARPQTDIPGLHCNLDASVNKMFERIKQTAPVFHPNRHQPVLIVLKNSHYSWKIEMCTKVCLKLRTHLRALHIKIGISANAPKGRMIAVVKRKTLNKRLLNHLVLSPTFYIFYIVLWKRRCHWKLKQSYTAINWIASLRDVTKLPFGGLAARLHAHWIAIAIAIRILCAESRATGHQKSP